MQKERDQGEQGISFGPKHSENREVLQLARGLPLTHPEPLAIFAPLGADADNGWLLFFCRER